MNNEKVARLIRQSIAALSEALREVELGGADAKHKGELEKILAALGCEKGDAALIVADKGERIGMKEARRPAAWYLKGMKGAARFRNDCAQLTTLDELERLIEKIRKEQESDE